MEQKKDYTKIQVLNIEAWRDSFGGWYENDVSTSDDDIFWVPDDTLYSTRKLLKMLRESGYLTDSSKGKVEIKTFPTMSYSCWVCKKSDHEPLFRIQEIDPNFE